MLKELKRKFSPYLGERDATGVFEEKGGWFFYNEVWDACGPYPSESICWRKLRKYIDECL